MDNYVFVNLNFILSQGEKIILIFDSQYIPLPLGIVFTPNTWSFWILAESEMLYSVKSYLTRLKFQCLSLLHELLCRHSALSLIAGHLCQVFWNVALSSTCPRSCGKPLHILFPQFSSHQHIHTQLLLSTFHHKFQPHV